MRFAADVRHILNGRPCSAITNAGAYCAAKSHYICNQCERPICGRHQTSHTCPPRPAET